MERATGYGLIRAAEKSIEKCIKELPKDPELSDIRVMQLEITLGLEDAEKILKKFQDESLFHDRVVKHVEFLKEKEVKMKSMYESLEERVRKASAKDEL